MSNLGAEMSSSSCSKMELPSEVLLRKEAGGLRLGGKDFFSFGLKSD
jgi:hypothetical protein